MNSYFDYITLTFHYKNEVMRRPEKPVGKDLIVIHAALNRILSFCLDEQL